MQTMQTTTTIMLVDAILAGVASTTANTFADARRLALLLHAERHAAGPDARLIAEALVQISAEAHYAAELAAQLAHEAAREAGREAGTASWQ